MTRHLRGDAICRNRLEVPLADAEEAVLTAVENDVLRVEVLETSLYKAVAALQAPTDFEDQSGALREELVQIDAEVARLAQAVAAGGEIPALIAAMQERERRRSHLKTQLAAVERQTPGRHDAGDVERALEVMREALTDWQGTLRQETGPARRAMQALLKGRLVFTPQEHGAERFYTFEGEGSISQIIAGIAGLQRVWWPQRDLVVRRVSYGRIRGGGDVVLIPPLEVAEFLPRLVSSTSRDRGLGLFRFAPSTGRRAPPSLPHRRLKRLPTDCTENVAAPSFTVPVRPR